MKTIKGRIQIKPANEIIEIILTASPEVKCTVLQCKKKGFAIVEISEGEKSIPLLFLTEGERHLWKDSILINYSRWEDELDYYETV